MSIKNYGELKAAVADWIDRTDLTDKIGDFIRMAETEVYRDLRVRDNEFSITLTNADNPKNPITLPQNYREMKLVTVNDCPISRISDQRYAALKSAGLSGDPTAFCTQERELYLLPWTDEDIAIDGSEVSVVIHYYGTESLGEMAFWNTPGNPNESPEGDGTPAEFAERTDASTTRMFLVNPEMYLFGACKYAYIYLREPEWAQHFGGMFDGALNQIKAERDQSDYAGSTVAVGSSFFDGSNVNEY